MSENTFQFTDDNFDEATGSGVSLVDFYADWCGPCRMLAPIVEKMAEEYEGKAKIGKLDVDNNQGVAARFNIASIPTVLVIKDGEVQQTFNGVQPESALRGAVDALI